MEDKYIRYSQVAILIAFIIGAIATYLVYHFSSKKEEREAREKALNGSIVNKNSSTGYKFPFEPPPLNFDAAIIVVGKNLFRWPKSAIGSGFSPFKLFPYENDTLNIPLTIKIVDNKLLVSTTIFDENSKVVCEISDNEWVVNANNYYKRNYDDNGIEVIDQQGNVVLSAELVQPFIAEVNGIFHSPSQEVVVFASKKDGMTISKTTVEAKKRREKRLGKSWKQFYFEQAKFVERKFIYNGKDFLGKRIPPSN